MPSTGSTRIWPCDSPRIHWTAHQVEKEYRWLSKLAPYLLLAIPAPLVIGRPAEEYPWR